MERIKKVLFVALIVLLGNVAIALLVFFAPFIALVLWIFPIWVLFRPEMCTVEDGTYQFSFKSKRDTDADNQV